MPIRIRIRGFSLVAAALAIAGAALGAEPARSEPGQTAPVSIALEVGCKLPCPKLPADLDDYRSFGLRITETRLASRDRDTTAVGALFALNHHQYATLAELTSRLREYAFVGGGNGGFEGGIGGDLAFGWRAALASDHGPFGRLGMRGELFGNDVFYSSSLELPVGQLGYQLIRNRSLLIEAAFSTAPTLIGRYNVEGAAARRLGGSFDWGGHLALFVRAIHLEASYSRLEPKHDSSYGALDTLRGELCGAAGFVALCGNLHYLRGDVHSLAGDVIAPARTWYLGAYLGFSTTPLSTRPAQKR